MQHSVKLNVPTVKVHDWKQNNVQNYVKKLYFLCTCSMFLCIYLHLNPKQQTEILLDYDFKSINGCLFNVFNIKRSPDEKLNVHLHKAFQQKEV